MLFPLDGMILRRALIETDESLTEEEREKELEELDRILRRRDIAFAILTLALLALVIAEKAGVVHLR